MQVFRRLIGRPAAGTKNTQFYALVFAKQARVCFNSSVKTTFKKIGLIGKYLNQDALHTMRGDLIQLAQHLTQQGYQLTVESLTAEYADIQAFPVQAIATLIAQVDIIIVMGGDGTMLSVARSLEGNQIPLIGINRGRFGFLTDLRAEDMLSEIDAILQGHYQSESRMLLSAEIHRGDEHFVMGQAFNDVVIKSHVRLIELDVSIDHQFVSRQRSDGLIISTPTGTTAYSLSAGGPILHANLQAIALVPICPHTLSNRPIAVSSDSQISVKLLHSQQAQLSIDGQAKMELQAGDLLRVARSQHSVTLLHPKDYSYFERLRNKLHWS